MPFLRVFTNVGRSKLPANFMPNLTKSLAVTLNKPPELFKWILETDKYMSNGVDNAERKLMIVEIESLIIFKEKENCEKFVGPIFQYLTSSTDFKKEEIITKFYEVEPYRLGMNGIPKSQDL